ncbi:hypothetical protein GCM10007426_41600 [Alloalcanivorax dieselolei]|uniref:hypothetical protein n=1 Tax=Alloalcanivorax dieselolei TaxID=285091 RepID=UPI0011D29FCE|nr:hypothetical protein [Alloalcanivorax dieselolei]GGK09068.1 hypothetical protein GCM10007426_41600 [Alloalcanivorax dieselolei]
MVFLLLLVCAGARAEFLEGTVDRVGCHIDKDECFVVLDSPVMDVSKCSNDSSAGLRWGSSGEHAYAALSIIMNAKVNNMKVLFGGVGDTCFGDFLSFRWVTLKD